MNPVKRFIKRQPLLLVAIAAAILVGGVDLVELEGTVEQLTQLTTLVGAFLVAHHKVTPA